MMADRLRRIVRMSHEVVVRESDGTTLLLMEYEHPDGDATYVVVEPPDEE
jgi:hypothetical protein